VAAPEDAGPSDRGLQNERTALAWQRTLLSGLACALVSTRLTAPVSEPLALVTGFVALVCTAALAELSRRRFRSNARALAAHRPLADGRAPLLVTVLVLLTGVLAAVVVLGGVAVLGGAQS